ncbi:MAG: Ig-like domain-containing protein [Bacteroidales bacterium]|nr:Ig-like domain-containing protein [Bacteroidales bacterium]
MKAFRQFFIIALAAGLAASCGDALDQISTGEDTGWKASLTATPASTKISNDGTATVTFRFGITSVVGVQETDLSKYTATITFEASGGSVSPESATTDESGNVTVTFTTPDPQSFTGGSVTGTVLKVANKGDDTFFQQGTLATATATILPLDAEEPGGGSVIEQAEKLKDNTYSVQKKGGEVQVYELPQEYSQWWVGSSWMDGTKQCIHVECMDEDKDNMTQGWLSGEIPPEVANKLTIINQEFYEKYPWAGAKLGTMRLGQDNMLDAHFGVGGNVKTDGSSAILLKEKSSTKAYSGQYQFLAVFVFANQVYDQETDSYIAEGDEYTICINATLDELVAELSYFRLDYSSSWVAPGQSITLTADWTAGASFDWSKVTLNNQTRNNYSGDWFSWDASTQTLTAKTSADNEQVELEFGYAGTDMTSKISLYNGPGYSSFSLSMENSSADYIVAENDPAYGWGSDTIWLTVDAWTPAGSSFTGYGIEIDPATENYNKLDYNPYGKYVNFRKGIPEGEFNLIFRSVTDHSVKFTIPVKVVKHKPTSFQITYRHSNGNFEPWTSGGENGVCNYPMGMELGVITEPEDAYWNWADVELASDYDGFAFNGYGGKDEHPKLQRTKSNPGGGTGYGTQIIFRLKYNNRKTSTIYVDHN